MTLNLLLQLASHLPCGQRFAPSHRCASRPAANEPLLPLCRTPRRTHRFAPGGAEIQVQVAGLSWWSAPGQGNEDSQLNCRAVIRMIGLTPPQHPLHVQDAEWWSASQWQPSGTALVEPLQCQAGGPAALSAGADRCSAWACSTRWPWTQSSSRRRV